MASNLFNFILCFGVMINFFPKVQADNYKFDFEVNEKASRLSNSSGQYDVLTNTWRMGLQSELFGDWLKSSGEVVYGKFSQGQQLNLLDSDKYYFNINLEGKYDKLGYGINYFLLGKNYYGEYDHQKYPDKDRTGYNSWLSYEFQRLLLKGSYTESWSNIENNPDEPRIMDKWYRIDSKFKFNNTPFRSLSLSYGIGNRQRFVDISSAKNAYLGQLNYAQVKAEFAFKYIKFTAGAYRFAFKKEKSNHKEVNENFFINAKVFPDYVVSFHPSFNYQQQSFLLGASKKVKKRSKSSLLVLFKPTKEQYRISFTTIFDQNSKSYLSERPNTLKLMASIDWYSPKNLSGLPLDWSLNSRYKQIKGFRNSDMNYSDWAVDLNLHWRFI